MGVGSVRVIFVSREESVMCKEGGWWEDWLGYNSLLGDSVD